MCAKLDIAFVFGSFMSYFPAVLLRHFLDYLEVVPESPVFTCFTAILTFHMRCSSIVRILYFKIFSASFFFIKFLFFEIATCINRHAPFSLSRIMCPFIVRTASVDLYLLP